MPPAKAAVPAQPVHVAHPELLSASSLHARSPALQTPALATCKRNVSASSVANQTASWQALTTTTAAIHYTYDPLQRLTGATATGATTYTLAYAYDAVSNRMAQTQTITSTLVTNYTYDAANGLTSVNGQAYTWDNNGNLKNDSSKVYTYTQANRLVTITANDLNWSATYNGDGARLRQVNNGVPTTYTLDLAAPLVQALTMQDAGGKTAYLYGMTRLGEQQPGGWAYHLSDALGSVRQLADSSAQVTLAQGYMPYGERLWSVGSGSSAYGFTGEDWNVTTQLVFLRARYLQPGLGMFLSRDPWRGDDLQPMTFNGWGYVEGDPVNNTDPSGDCVGCAVNSLAKVVGANAAGMGGAAFRQGPSQRFPTRYPHRLPDGTTVRIWSNAILGSDGLQWRWVSLFNLPPTINGYVADNYLEPAFSPPPPPPSSGSGARLTQLPVDNPRYDNGYGRYSWGPHDGYDIISQVPDNQTVYSMGSGKVVDMDTPNLPGVKCSTCGVVTDHPYFLIRIELNTGIWIRYVHIKATRLCIGDRVTAGTIIGEYAQVGQSNYPHVHVSIEKPEYYATDPGPYWPGRAPTVFHWGNPDPM